MAPRSPRTQGSTTLRAVTHPAVTASVAILSAAAALSAATAIYWRIDDYQQRVESAIEAAREDVVSIPVAARTLGVGTLLAASDLELREFPTTHVPRLAITDPLLLVGRAVQHRILVNEPFRAERLAQRGAGLGLEALIPAGSRALSLDLKDGEQVSGFVEPGAFVDLLVTIIADDTRPSETVTLLQAVRVLAVDERISETAAGAEVRSPRITVLLTPEHAERTTHALSEGQPKLTLRSDIDIHRQESNGTTSADLLGRSAQRMTSQQFNATFDDDDVWAMIDMVAGRDKIREPVPVDVESLTLEGFDGPPAGPD